MITNDNHTRSKVWLTQTDPNSEEKNNSGSSEPPVN